MKGSIAYDNQKRFKHIDVRMREPSRVLGKPAWAGKVEE